MVANYLTFSGGGTAGGQADEPFTINAPAGYTVGGSGIVENALNAAMGMLGTMYKWGGSSASGVDCSGLIYYALNAAGYNIARYNARTYGSMGKAVSAAQARPGDIVYFAHPGQPNDHVGIYLGNGKFIEAYDQGYPVRINTVSDEVPTSYRRILPDSAWSGMPKNAAGQIYYQYDGSSYYGGGASSTQTTDYGYSNPSDSATGLSFNQFFYGLGMQESGGDYSAVQKSTGALGKYQILPSNIASWSKQILGHSITPAEFLANPSEQEQIARGMLTNAFVKYGAAGAASWWYSGDASLKNSTKPQKNGPSIAQYVQQVLGRARNAPATSAAVTTGADYYMALNTGNVPMSVEQAMAQYGFIGTLSNEVPELKNILTQAAQEGWDSQRFQNAVQDSQWWKSHADQLRQNMVLKATDPATYNQNLKRFQDQTKTMLANAGVTLDTKDFNDLVNFGFNQSWSQSEMMSWIAQHGTLQTQGKVGGQAGELSAQLKAAAASYGIRTTQSSVDQGVRAILGGKATLDSWTASYQQQAKQLYPNLSQAIDNGQTVRQIADPYIQALSSLWEVNPEEVNTTDPSVQYALQAKDKNGSITGAMPLYQYEDYLRSNPRWLKTDNAKKQAVAMVGQLGSDWGFAF